MNERWNVENMSLSEFNFGKFSYQRKPSAFSRRNSSVNSTTGIIQNQPCASTLNSQLAQSSSTERCSTDFAASSCDSNEANNELEPHTNGEDTCTSFTASIVSCQELAEVMENLPSEIRLHIVDAITSSSSSFEAMNEVSDNQLSSSGEYSDI